MRRLAVLVAAMALFLLTFASTSFAAIHPIVESFDCAQASGLVNRPQGGDVADPPGQFVSGFAALSNANANAFSDFKVNGTCGQVGKP